MDVRIVMNEFGTHLTTRPAGIRDFGRVCERLANVRPGDTVLLDFEQVEYVSASWIAAMMVPLSRRASEEANDFFLLIGQFPNNSLDDLQLVAEQAHIPFLVVTDFMPIPSKAKLLGILDFGQKETLSVVQQMGEVTGAMLAAMRPEFKASGPAWNNRLKDLFEKRLLRRRKQGRDQIYKLIVSEVIVNG